MSFRVVEHVIPGQHIREHPYSIQGRQEAPLYIAIKQYIPLDQVSPVSEDAVTVIGAHGVGCPKELFEPFWERLYAHMKKQSVPLRAIWIADFSNHGASGILNEEIQGDRPSWFDHSRDLLHMVNHFRDEIPRPIIGVGHSMGCAQLVQLSIIHPRLLSSLILFEAGILEPSPGQINPAQFVARRRDIWNTREEAEKDLRKRFRAWDLQVVDRYLEFGLRSIPTKLYSQDLDPKLPASAVTLTTSRHQESWTHSLSNLEPESATLDRLLLPNWSVDKERPYSTARPECGSSMRNLPFVRPSVLWVYGDKSFLLQSEKQDANVRATGTGVGGSGGVAQGMVEKVVLEGGSHDLLYEETERSAEAAGNWLGRWFQGWMADEKVLSEYQNKRSDPTMVKASEADVRTTRMPSETARPRAKL